MEADLYLAIIFYYTAILLFQPVPFNVLSLSQLISKETMAPFEAELSGDLEQQVSDAIMVPLIPFSSLLID